jgi:hypothetical protein
MKTLHAAIISGAIVCSSAIIGAAIFFSNSRHSVNNAAFLSAPTSADAPTPEPLTDGELLEQVNRELEEFVEVNPISESYRELVFDFVGSSRSVNAELTAARQKGMSSEALQAIFQKAVLNFLKKQEAIGKIDQESQADFVKKMKELEDLVRENPDAFPSHPPQNE